MVQKSIDIEKALHLFIQKKSTPYIAEMFHISLRSADRLKKNQNSLIPINRIPVLLKELKKI